MLCRAMWCDAKDRRDRAAGHAAVPHSVASAALPANDARGIEGGVLSLLHGGVKRKLRPGVSEAEARFHCVTTI